VKILVRGVAVVLMVLSLSACGSDAPLQVSTIQVGRALSSDNQVGQHTTVFKPDDTIYVSVLTTATGSGTVGVRWMFGERVISEPSKEVSYKGAAATEFHIQNSGGFPEGRYSVEAFLDGASVGKRTFSVEK
jgi:predicted small lipoprotein YifL